VLGAARMVLAAVVLMLALAWGGRRYAWSSPEVFGMIAASALLWGLFALRLARAPEPFIPLSMLRDRVVGAIIVTGFFSIGTVIGISIYIPLYIELVLGLTACQSGLALIAFIGGDSVGFVIEGRLGMCGA